MRYATGVTNEPCTDEAILRESGRRVPVPRDGVLVEEGRRLLAHLPAPWNTCRVWRSRTSSAGEAEDLIREILMEARTTGRSRVVWHTGGGVSSTFVENLLPDHGFRTAEELEVLAFELGDEPDPRLSRLDPNPNIATRIARGAYRALVVERCRTAHTIGATLALTKANTRTSAPLLAASGFRPVAHERRHVLDLCP